MPVTTQTSQRSRPVDSATQSAEQYETFFEKNATPMWVYDMKTLQFLAVNKAAIEIYGYSREEFLEMTIKDIRPEKDVPALLEALERQGTKGGASYARVWCLRKKNGSSINAEVVANPIIFEGKPARLAQAFDVNDRERAAEALRESEARYRAVVEYAPYAMSVSVDDKVVYVNPAAIKVAGVKSAYDLLGHSVTEFIHEDFREASKQRFIEMLRSGHPATPVQVKLLRPDGSIVDAESMGVPIMYGGKSAVLNSFKDITETLWAEGLLAGEKRVLECIAKRRSLADVLNEICLVIEGLSPEAMSSILLLDPDGKRLRPGAGPKLPACWAQVLNPLPIGPAVGSCGTAAFRKEQVIVSDISTDPLWTGYPDYSELALKCGLRACWSSPILAVDGQVLGTFALYYQKPRSPSPKDLDLIKQVTHLASVAIEHDRAAQAVRRARDELETRVKERTAELVRANERLAELDRLKSQFLAGMSHELRTPLNSIIGFTGILQQGLAGPINDEQKKQLGLVFGSGRHLLSLINDLLDLSRIEAGKAEVERQPFDFVGVVNEVIDNLSPMAKQKKLSLATDLPGPHVPMVGDRKRSFQVLLNLVNNAVKFTHVGGVEIIVRTEAEKLRVTVADTGIGIKPEQMGMLFEAFRQLDGSARRMYEGTGLGLHLCRRLLTLMGGEISVESKYGEGSRFTFLLPLKQPPETSDVAQTLAKMPKVENKEAG